ncbi:Uncharacterized protein Adt_26567 [Abeliophyllum distichum]|uniref:PAS fold-2 domain-containing protein n=1 Tax=Abeliophyllum distichum TaxID=126358 RepID=A0ABD1RR97_9LAMI
MVKMGFVELLDKLQLDFVELLQSELGKWSFKSNNNNNYYEGRMFPLLVKEQLEFWPEKDVRQRIWMSALKTTNKELKGMMKTVKIQDIDNLQDKMMDLMDVSNEIQESLGRSYSVPDDIDEEELMGELDTLEADMGMETEGDGVPSYLQPDKEFDLDAELNLPSAPTGHAPGKKENQLAKLLHSTQLMLGSMLFLSNRVSGKSFDYSESIKTTTQSVPEQHIAIYLSKIQRGGHIQPFGCMIAVEESNFHVISYSKNAREMLGLTPQSVPSLEKPEILTIGFVEFMIRAISF